MKNCTFLKMTRSGLLGLSLLVLASAAPAAAQTDNANGNARRADATDNRRDDRREDDNTDWGWLGLLGLAGLLGLMPRKTAHVVRDRDPLDRDHGGTGDRR